jgi:hypothetical protein
MTQNLELFKDCCVVELLPPSLVVYFQLKLIGKEEKYLTTTNQLSYLFA